MCSFRYAGGTLRERKTENKQKTRPKSFFFTFCSALAEAGDAGRSAYVGKMLPVNTNLISFFIRITVLMKVP